MPHDHQHVLADYHLAGPEHVQQAIAAAADGAARVGELAVGGSRGGAPARRRAARRRRGAPTINAATMLGQSKTAFQAEIDAASEMIDFWRFNAYFAQELLQRAADQQPTAMWNQMEYRALEGFVYAVTPFNFTAIGGNLPTAPALMGNTVIWKPASSAMLSGYYMMQAARGGRPAARASSTSCPATPSQISNTLLDSPRSRRRPLHRQHGGLQQHVEDDRREHRPLPRLSAPRRRNRRQGLHRRAPVGRSAGARRRDRARRVRVPGAEVLGREPRLRAAVALERRARSHGRDDEGHQDGRRPRLPQLHGRGHRQEGVHQDQRLPRRREEEREGAAGRRPRRATRATSSSRRWSRRPIPATGCCARRSSARSSRRTSIDDAKWEETLAIVDRDVAVRADRRGVRARSRARSAQATSALRNAAGNFYINDKPTGAVVGQQPFGGARASGTNDKAGSKLNLVRWVSARTVKETFAPPRDYKYPFMAEE